MESDEPLLSGIEDERFLKTGCFASKWLIEIEAKGTNQRENQSFGVNIETKLKRRVCCYE